MEVCFRQKLLEKSDDNILYEGIETQAYALRMNR